MDFIGFDLGKVSSQVCIITEGGELVERRVRTDREQITKLLGGRSNGWRACSKGSGTRSSSPTRTSRPCTPHAAAG